VMHQNALPSAEARTRFLREARVAAGLSHPNICGVYQIQHADSGLYLVLQYVDGQDLADLLVNGPLPLERLIAIGREMADALEAVHAERMVHRDVKPRNIRVTREGKAILLDFGLTRPVEADPESSGLGATELHSITEAGLIMGTIAYMSPEQSRGDDLLPASDVFSLGTTLYEALTGVSPFDAGDLQQTVMRIQQHDPPPAVELRPETPAYLSELIASAMNKDPAARPDAAALKAALTKP